METDKDRAGMAEEIKGLNRIVTQIITAKTEEEKAKKGERLFAFTVDPDAAPVLRELAENIAMLMIQKEGRELHLEIMEKDLEKKTDELAGARHDSLTGLAGRGLFYDSLDRAFDRARKKEKKMGVILLDLDRFKPVNDTYGHDAGDELLVQSAARISGAVGDRGSAARLGGDEFVVLLPDLGSENEADEVARQILLRIKKPFTLKSATVFIDASMGVAFMNKDIPNGRVVLKHADQAMYQAKEAGRGRYVIHRPG